MTIIINDKKHEFPYGYTLQEVVDNLQLPTKGTAIAVNDKIVKRDHWADTTLAEGDVLLIISATYGG